jgi:hypothetical protein
MVQPDAGHPEAELTGSASPRFGHDFSRISIYPPAAGAIQPNLAVGQVNDPLEHEADRIAEQVMRMPASPSVALTAAPQVSRECAACEEEEKFQRKSGSMLEASAVQAPAIVHQVLRSPGQPLDAATRAYFEPRFRRDLSQVRIHSGARAAESARAVNSRAYTVGSEIVFGVGESTSDRPLLAHELAHTAERPSSGASIVLRRTPGGPGRAPARSLEEISQGIARLLFGPNTQKALLDLAREFPGIASRVPVLSVVRDDLGRIYVAHNIPKGKPELLAAHIENLTGHIAEQLQVHQARVASGHVTVVQTSPIAVGGGHAEVVAVNKAIATREAELGHALSVWERSGFQLHNVWLSGEDRFLMAAPRCEHCIGITHGIPTTESVFEAELRAAQSAPGLKGPHVASLIPARSVAGEIDTELLKPSGGGSPPRSGGASGAAFGTEGLATSESKALTAKVKAAAIAESPMEAKALGTEAKMLRGEGTALEAARDLAKTGQIPGRAARIGALLLELGLPGPWDVLFLFVSAFGSIAEAKAKLKADAFATGFGQGLAAALTGTSGSDANWLLMSGVGTPSEGERVAGFEGVRDRGTKEGVAAGFKFGQALDAEERQGFLAKCFATIASSRWQARWHGITQEQYQKSRFSGKAPGFGAAAADEELAHEFPALAKGRAIAAAAPPRQAAELRGDFGRNELIKMGTALRPTVIELLEEAERQRERRDREEARRASALGSRDWIGNKM